MRTTRVFCSTVAAGLLAVAMGGTAAASEGPGAQTKDIKAEASGATNGSADEPGAKRGGDAPTCPRPAHDCSTKPAHKPAEKPDHKAEKPAEKPDHKAEKPAEKPDHKAEKPAEKPDHKAEKPAEKPMDDKPMDKPAHKPADKPMDKPMDPMDKPAEKPADKPEHKPGHKPGHKSDGTPTVIIGNVTNTVVTNNHTTNNHIHTTNVVNNNKTVVVDHKPAKKPEWKPAPHKAKHVTPNRHHEARPVAATHTTQTRTVPVGSVAGGAGGTSGADDNLIGLGAALAVAGAGVGAFVLRRGSLRG